MSTLQPPHDDSGHLPSCEPDCVVGVTDEYLDRAFASYDELLAGLSHEQQDDLLRRAWVDDDGRVHVRQLQALPTPPEQG